MKTKREKFTFESLHALGYRPDGTGALAKTPHAPHLDQGMGAPEPERIPLPAPLVEAPPIQEGRPGKIILRIESRRFRLLDDDNSNGGVKWLVDAIRHEGLIPNDSRGEIELVTTQTRVPKAEVETVITIIYP